MSDAPAERTSLRTLALLFLRLGATAFGGPAAHIAMMQDEVVNRRRWMTDERFLDLLGATNLIPGPNSTEMAIHIGYERRGFPGLVLAGVGFIVPAMLITAAIAWVYVRYGTLPAAAWLLYGVKPVVIAVVVQALVALGRKAAPPGPRRALAALCALAVAAGAHELAVLFGAGAVAAAAALRPGDRAAGFIALPLLPAGVAGVASAVTLPSLFWVFLKTGSVLFGSGYVLLAFLRADLVERLHWMSESQLIDAIAVGQLTPGPVFSTATFIGWTLAGPAGAGLATLGIFLPAFVFVALSGPLVPRLRRSRVAGGFLDGVNGASLALMAVVTAQLGRDALVDAPTVILAIAATVALLRWKVNSAWLVLGGIAAGALLGAVR